MPITIIKLSLEEKERRTDPFQWWNLKKLRFPKLSKIARKYLCISATSVSSERLFSDVGNNIIAKRTNLDSELVGEILFLKRNMDLLDSIFPANK